MRATRPGAVWAERRRVRVSGGEMAYLDLGEGWPVLLLHGFPTSSFLWRRELPLLAAGMRVVAPDLLGYGDSDKPPGALLSGAAQVGYLRELLAALDITEVAVVGHELGGALALGLAAAGGPRVRALVLLAPALAAVRPTEAVRSVARTPPDDRTAEAAARSVRSLLARGMAHPERIDEQAVSGYLGPWQSDPAALFRAAEALAAGDGSSGEELPPPDVPTLILWGEEDPFLPSALGERLAERIEDSTLALLPGCSHFLTEDAPRTVGPLVAEYLRSRYLGRSHRHPGPGPVRVFLERPPAHLGRPEE